MLFKTLKCTEGITVVSKTVMVFMRLLLLMLVIRLQCIVCKRLWCPHKNYIAKANNSINLLKTAIITEIHGDVGVYVRGPGAMFGPMKTHFYAGSLLSRNIYHHVGIVGIDKVYISVMYNASIYPNAPTIDDIYPKSKYCLVDWYNLGVIVWRTVPYLGPEETWPLDNNGKPTNDRDSYKTLRGINPIYEGTLLMLYSTDIMCYVSEIRNYTDWIFVLDSDELLIPINYNISLTSDWCRSSQSIVALCLQQMLKTATMRYLETYEIMNSTLQTSYGSTIVAPCPIGYGRSQIGKLACRPITAFSMPVYLWTRKNSNESQFAFPSYHTRFPTSYAARVNTEIEADKQARTWKSVYQTKYNPLLRGRSMHDNPIRGLFPLLAPRAYHNSLSLEVAHLRGGYVNSSLMTDDKRLVLLSTSLDHCLRRVAAGII